MDALVAVLIFTLPISASSAAIATSDGTCTGFFSAFCMQEKRPKPTACQQYDLAAVGDLTVVVHQEVGKIANFSATRLLEFTSEGEHTSVKVSLDQTRLASLNAQSVSVIVPRHVALLPRLPQGMVETCQERDLETANRPRRFAVEFF